MFDGGNGGDGVNGWNWGEGVSGNGWNGVDRRDGWNCVDSGDGGNWVDGGNGGNWGDGGNGGDGVNKRGCCKNDLNCVLDWGELHVMSDDAHCPFLSDIHTHLVVLSPVVSFS